MLPPGRVQELATIAYYGGSRFIPVALVTKLGFSEVTSDDIRVIIWKPFDPLAEPPRFLAPGFDFTPAPDKAAIELFWMTFCGSADKRDVTTFAARSPPRTSRRALRFSAAKQGGSYQAAKSPTSGSRCETAARRPPSTAARGRALRSRRPLAPGACKGGFSR